MSTSQDVVKQVAALLRSHRQARAMTVVGLAKAVGVSPRLVSEFERGKRPHVSLETALRLLQEVGAPINFAANPTVDEDAARAERAAHRRKNWKFTISTLAEQGPPDAPPDAAARMVAVASASQLVGNLRTAYEQQQSPKVTARGRGAAR